MPRDGSGNFTLPANTQAVSGDPISSTKYNTLVQDLESDANTDRPIAAGGTGASTAQAALTNLFSGASPGGADKIGGWDQSASAFAFFSLGSGLSFSGTTIGLDADLVTLAGLTPTADNFIVGNSGGTAWEVKTPAQARTSIGLPIGTSGATVPLLNGANTWSAAQTLSGAGLKWATTSTTSADPGFHMTNSSARLDRILNTSSGLYIGVDATGTERTLTLSTAGVLAVGGNTVWHAGNDGAGSGLDADTVDGIQASALVQTSGAQSVGGVKTFTSQVAINYSGSPELSVTDSTGGANGVFRAVAGTSLTFGSTNNVPIIVLANNAEVARFINGGGFVARAAASSETTGTLTVASANRTIQATGDITIDNSVFTAGDIILIYAGASARTITQGAGVTMRLGGTATTGSRTLAARGVAMLFFVSASEVVVSGGAVT